MLLVKGFSKTGLFRNLYDYLFRDRNFGNTKSMRVIFFSKYLKLHLDFKNAAKTSGKVFCYLDNCIWIGIVKLSLFRTGYFSSAANVWGSTHKILHVNKRDFSGSIDFPVINEYDQSAVTQISKAIGNVYHAGCRKVLRNVSF